jgi:hypothetical protein
MINIILIIVSIKGTSGIAIHPVSKILCQSGPHIYRWETEGEEHPRKDFFETNRFLRHFYHLMLVSIFCDQKQISFILLQQEILLRILEL